jgi:hypothetical protein
VLHRDVNFGRFNEAFGNQIENIVILVNVGVGLGRGRGRGRNGIWLL